jgi:hypothetical protein
MASSQAVEKFRHGVLASVRDSKLRDEVSIVSSPGAALLDGLFEEPAGSASAILDLLQPCVSQGAKSFLTSSYEMMGDGRWTVEA